MKSEFMVNGQELQRARALQSDILVLRHGVWLYSSYLWTSSMQLFTMNLKFDGIRLQSVATAREHTGNRIEEDCLVAVYTVDPSLGVFLEVFFFPEVVRKPVELRTNSAELAQKLQASKFFYIKQDIEESSGARLDVFWYSGDVCNAARGFTVSQVDKRSVNLET